LVAPNFQTYSKHSCGNALYVSFIDNLAGGKSDLYWPILPPKEQSRR